MSNTSPNSSSPAPRRNLRAGRSRAARVAIAGGLAAGSAFAAFAGISIANTTTSHTQTTSSSRSSASAPAPRGPRGRGLGPLGGPGGPKGLGGPEGHGGPGGPNSGTITAINGSTLTLRSENGTETVDTSSTTTYSKELQTINFSDLHAGDIVGVAPVPPSSSSSSSGGSSSTPPQPGTGTVKAATVTVVKPSITGRVTSSSNGTYSLVGPGGQLLTVTTTGSTRFYNSSMSKTSASAISSGDHVVAEGTQSDLTHLTADVIAVMPTTPTPPEGVPHPPTARSTSGARRASRTARSGSSSSRSRSSTTSSH